jgi:hypothetical protein
MEAATKLALEFLKVVASWPVVVGIGLLMFRKQIRSLAEGPSFTSRSRQQAGDPRNISGIRAGAFGRSDP